MDDARALEERATDDRGRAAGDDRAAPGAVPQPEHEHVRSSARRRTTSRCGSTSWRRAGCSRPPRTAAAARRGARTRRARRTSASTARRDHRRADPHPRHPVQRDRRAQVQGPGDAVRQPRRPGAHPDQHGALPRVRQRPPALDQRARAERGRRFRDAMADIQKILRREHRLRQGRPDDFQIRNQADFLNTLGETTQVFTLPARRHRRGVACSSAASAS